MKEFQRILSEEKFIDQRSLEEAFQTIYNKDRKHDWSTIEYTRFRTDMLEVGSLWYSYRKFEDYPLI